MTFKTLSEILNYFAFFIDITTYSSEFYTLFFNKQKTKKNGKY